MPRHGPESEQLSMVPFRRADAIRRRVYGNYLIFYRTMSDAVEVLHVLHGARDYENLIFPDDEP